LTIAVISCGAVLVASIRYFPILDVLALGREQAINLGVAYDKAVWRLLIMVIILVSTATSLVGPITFLGLLVVNLAWQLLATYRHRTIIWGAFLLSIITLVGGQLVGEHVLNFAVPISTLINLIGGIYFIRLLVKEK
jgi:iron complex transport system permease protein